MLSLFFRNVFFTIIQPGLVDGLIPYWILGSKVIKSFNWLWQFHQYIGSFLFITGSIIMLHCITMFAVEGRGTLSPADPTKRLVIKGLYKFSSNPMYVGVMMMLVGEAFFFQSRDLWIYSFAVFLCFNLFVIAVEEPRLPKDFGAAYNQYCKKVNRWF